VALVLDYLEQVKNGRTIPEADENDERFDLLDNEDNEFDDDKGDTPVLRGKNKNEIDAFLKGMTKEKLIDLIHELQEQHPEITRDIIDRQEIQSDDKKPMIKRLRREIREIASEPGWQNYWNHEGYTPDYSGIRKKLKNLLEEGYADDVLSLGRELMDCGIKNVEISNDEGETAMEIGKCIPIIVKALAISSISQEEKLTFAVDSLIDDHYSMFESFSGYLDRRHPVAAWDGVTNRLINRLNNFKSDKESDSSRDYRRDRISDWVIYAMEKAGRLKEIIPLCEAEAEKTGCYVRLVKRLIDDKRYEEAEQWIHKSIEKVGERWPGIASTLRGELLNIRTRKKDWLSVVSLKVFEFVTYPSDEAFSTCKRSAEKVGVWPEVRESLLKYLENGTLPWRQKGWTLPEPDFDYSRSRRGESFPMYRKLIDIAILEKKPEQVLAWYDKMPKSGYGWANVELDNIAMAIQNYATDRAVAMWKIKAEGLMAQAKPKAYQEAARYLRKAAKVMSGRNNQKEWDSYILQLKGQHARKSRLIEVLDRLSGRPIVQIKP
jgi:uncharacterized Zn finger protein